MESQLTQRGSGRELAIVLHGPHGSPEEMQGVSKAIEERSEDMDILAPTLPYGGFFGLFRTTSVEQIVRDVVEEIFGKALQTFATLFDIGSSGYDGFDEH